MIAETGGGGGGGVPSATDIANLTGFPDLIVPAGFTGDNLPVGNSFFGPAFSEQKILSLGYSFEQATHTRAGRYMRLRSRGNRYQCLSQWVSAPRESLRASMSVSDIVRQACLVAPSPDSTRRAHRRRWTRLRLFRDRP